MALLIVYIARDLHKITNINTRTYKIAHSCNYRTTIITNYKQHKSIPIVETTFNVLLLGYLGHKGLWDYRPGWGLSVADGYEYTENQKLHHDNSKQYTAHSTKCSKGAELR